MGSPSAAGPSSPSTNRASFVSAPASSARCSVASGVSARSSGTASPSSASPVMFQRVPSGVHASSTVISLRVSVPVLSEPMTVVEPSVSTAGSLRISALRPAIRRTPKAKATVSTTGRPSGTTATARATATRNISPRSRPRASPMSTATSAEPRTASAMTLANALIRSCSGVSPPSCSRTCAAMPPSSVLVPVSTTRARPPPRETLEPM